MRVAGLFTGVGGLELGLSRAGHECVIFSENWAPAAAVLRARFPQTENCGDIRQLDDLPAGIDLVTAGFPCQDLSQAGMTAGIRGSRSRLVENVFRLADKAGVPTLLFENVSFMLRLDRGSAMERLTSALEERRFRWAYRIVNSLAFLPQRRERVFLLASREIDPANVLLVDDVAAATVVTSLDTHAHGFYWTEGLRGLGWGPDCVPTLKNGSTVGIPSPPAVLRRDGQIITPDLGDAERLQGFSDGWTEPASLVARCSLRWSLVGNAVTVPVATWLARRLAVPGRYDAKRDRPISEVKGWPRAARFDGRSRFVVEIGDRPVDDQRQSLQDFLVFPGKPLSVRATSGFLKRIERSNLRFVPGFVERVRQHLAVVEREHIGSPTQAVPAAE